jgi:hypothetical protein
MQRNSCCCWRVGFGEKAQRIDRIGVPHAKEKAVAQKRRGTRNPAPATVPSTPSSNAETTPHHTHFFRRRPGFRSRACARATGHGEQVVQGEIVVQDANVTAREANEASEANEDLVE